MTFIETDRLALRNIAAKDAAIIHDYRNNEICARYQRGQTKDYDGIIELVEKRKNDVISIRRSGMQSLRRYRTGDQ